VCSQAVKQAICKRIASSEYGLGLIKKHGSSRIMYEIEQQAGTYEASSFVETGSSAVNRWMSAIEHSLSG
jgi:hypothetical protein